MGKYQPEGRAAGRLAAAIALAALVGACAFDPPAPAPVIMNGAGPGVVDRAPMAPSRLVMVPPAPRPREQHVVVRPGQSLGGIARDYRVPERAIIVANHLSPPYKLETGQRLIIPGGSEPSGSQFAMATPLGAPPAAAVPPADIIPLDAPRPAPASIKPPIVPAQPQPHVATLTLPTTPAVARHPPGEPSAAEEARAEAAPAASPSSSHAEHFAWPVRGHVVAGYGAAVGGARNDGINIAAPQGTPVKAVDGGTVAYVGNELRGYGNLVLIKHEGGWISAYAHCETLLVKQGEKVSRGQDIAKVGATGGVSEPQLHFELRRGQRAVDPREFLAPAPSAGSAARRG